DHAFLQRHHPDRDPDGFAAAWQGRNVHRPEVLAFEPNYQGSPVVFGGAGAPSARGDHRFEARAGHHLAPPEAAAAEDDPSPIFADGHTGFVLLARSGYEAGQLCSAFADAGVPLATRAVSDRAAASWNTAALLLRPDRFVA